MFTKYLINVDFIGVVAKRTHKKFVYYTWYCCKNATMLHGYNNNYIVTDNDQLSVVII